MYQSLICALLAAVLLFCGCASSDHSSPEIVVTISPHTATVLARGSQQFAAMVSGSSNNSVSWSVREGSAGGIVSDSGLYTAPLPPAITPWSPPASPIRVGPARRQSALPSIPVYLRLRALC